MRRLRAKPRYSFGSRPRRALLSTKPDTIVNTPSLTAARMNWRWKREKSYCHVTVEVRKGRAVTRRQDLGSANPADLPNPAVRGPRTCVRSHWNSCILQWSVNYSRGFFWRVDMKMPISGLGSPQSLSAGVRRVGETLRGEHQ